MNTQVSNEIDGFKIPEGLDAGHLRTVTDRLTEVVELARKADKTINAKRQTVADQLLSIARDCSNVKEFNAAVDLATIRFKAKHGKAPMPKVFTQTASDIRRMYAQDVDLSSRDPGTKEFLTYSKLKQAANKARAAAVAKTKELIEKTTPDYIKELRRIFSNLEALAKDRKSDTYLDHVDVIDEVVSFANDAYKAYMAEHPEALEVSEEGEEDIIHEAEEHQEQAQA